MKTAKEYFENDFGGRPSEAARRTGISRESWRKWKENGFANPMPPKLAAWVLKQQCADRPTRLESAEQ